MTPIIDAMILTATETLIRLEFMKTGDMSADHYGRLMPLLGALNKYALVDGSELAIESLRQQEAHRGDS